jgi:hypothetical protein
MHVRFLIITSKADLKRNQNKRKLGSRQINMGLPLVALELFILVAEIFFILMTNVGFLNTKNGVEFPIFVPNNCHSFLWIIFP